MKMLRLLARSGHGGSGNGAAATRSVDNEARRKRMIVEPDRVPEGWRIASLEAVLDESWRVKLRGMELMTDPNCRHMFVKNEHAEDDARIRETYHALVEDKAHLRQSLELVKDDPMGHVGNGLCLMEARYVEDIARCGCVEDWAWRDFTRHMFERVRVGQVATGKVSEVPAVRAEIAVYDFKIGVLREANLKPLLERGVLRLDTVADMPVDRAQVVVRVNAETMRLLGLREDEFPAAMKADFRKADADMGIDVMAVMQTVRKEALRAGYGGWPSIRVAGELFEKGAGQGAGGPLVCADLTVTTPDMGLSLWGESEVRREWRIRMLRNKAEADECTAILKAMKGVEIQNLYAANPDLRYTPTGGWIMADAVASMLDAMHRGGAGVSADDAKARFFKLDVDE